MGEQQHVVFLSGADMDPSAVLKRFPNARFVARGRVDANAGEIATQFAQTVASAGSAEVWGIVVRVDEPPASPGKLRAVTTDDGRTYEATQIGELLADGRSQLVLAAARYWELPTGYTGRLKMAVHELGKVEDDD